MILASVSPQKCQEWKFKGVLSRLTLVAFPSRLQADAVSAVCPVACALPHSSRKMLKDNFFNLGPKLALEKKSCNWKKKSWHQKLQGFVYRPRPLHAKTLSVTSKPEKKDWKSKSEDWHCIFLMFVFYSSMKHFSVPIIITVSIQLFLQCQKLFSMSFFCLFQCQLCFQCQLLHIFLVENISFDWIIKTQIYLHRPHVYIFWCWNDW